MPPTGDLLRKVYQNSQQPVLENNLHQRRRLLLWSGNKRQEFRQDYNPFFSHRHRRHWASKGAEGAGCSCKASHASPAVFSVCGMWKVLGKQASATQGQSRPGYNPVVNPLSAPSTSLLSAWLVTCRLCLSNQRTNSSKQRHSILKVKDFILSVVSRARVLRPS